MSRYLISLSDPRARAPLLCVLALLLACALQLALPVAPDLGERPAVGTRLAMTRVPATSVTFVPPSILAHPIFAPRVPMSLGGATPAVVAPLGGAAIAGVVSIGKARYAIVRDIAGKVSHVRLGGSVAGWRIAALDQDGATLTKGAERLHLAYGAAAPAVAATPDSEEESQ